MIRVKTIRKNGKVYGFLTEGHAMFDRYGKDVVCAAVSILTINTVSSFESFLPEEGQHRVFLQRGTLGKGKASA